MVLPSTNDSALSGAILTCSIVPRSFSRTIDSDVDSTDVIADDVGDETGNENSVLRSWGCTQTLGSTPIVGPDIVCTTRRYFCRLALQDR